LKKVVEGIYIMEGLSGCNVYFLVSDNGLILIDTGLPGNGRRITEQIEKGGYSVKDLKTIVLTHSHMDHAGSAAEIISITGAKVWAHSIEKPYIEQTKQLPYRGIMRRATMWLGNKLIYKLKPVKVDKELAEGDMPEGEPGFRVLHTPGHTPGSICLYSESRKILICGDTLFNRNPFTGTPGLQLSLPAATVDMEKVKESVRRLAKLPIDIILFGHGDPIMEKGYVKLRELNLE